MLHDHLQLNYSREVVDTRAVAEEYQQLLFLMLSNEIYQEIQFLICFTDLKLNTIIYFYYKFAIISKILKYTAPE